MSIGSSMNSDFTSDDVENLLEAVSAWEAEISRNGLMGSMMGAMLCPPGKRESFKADEEKRMAAERLQQRQRRDKATLLKAKIILIRQRIESESADKVIEEASRS